MGNKWPAYYNEVLMADKRKRAHSRKSKCKAAMTAATAFLDEHPNYMKDLDETVEQLRKELQGYCPTIDFESLNEAHK